MQKMTENNIIDALKNFTETPSDKCWESIANNLPLTTPSIPNNPPLPQNGFSHFFNSILGKFVLAIASIATVATIITLINNDSTIDIKNNPKVENSNIISDTIKVVNNSKESVKEDSENTNVYEIYSTQNQLIQPNNSLNQTTSAVEKELIKPISIVELAPNAHTNTSIKTNEPEIVNEQSNDLSNESTENSETLETNAKTEEITPSNEFSNFDLLKRPNVFTPNGDGYNDYLVFENIELFPKNRLIIINSNGVKTFEQNQYNNSWDAINIPDGTYFYILEVNNGQKTVSMYGSVQILR